jgi:Co/Zn/Cd efflux system component
VNREDELFLKLKEFYELEQRHHTISFWVSILAIGVGILVASFATGLFVDNPQVTDGAIVIAVCGVLIQCVGAVLFYIHNKNMDHMNASFSKFMAMQNTKNVIDLVEKMDEKNHDHMYMNIINMLLLRNEGQSEILPDLIKALRDSPKP